LLTGTDEFVDMLLKTLQEKSYVDEPVLEESSQTPDSTTNASAASASSKGKPDDKVLQNDYGYYCHKSQP
jgi:hypothetical protein